MSLVQTIVAAGSYLEKAVCVFCCLTWTAYSRLDQLLPIVAADPPFFPFYICVNVIHVSHRAAIVQCLSEYAVGLR